MLPTTFRSIQPSCSRVEDLQKSTNQKQELPVAAMFINGSGRNQHSLQRTAQRCFLPSFGSFGQAVSEKNFKNQPIRNKNHLWRPCLLTDREEMSNCYRGPPILQMLHTSFGSFDKAVSDEKIFRNRPIRNKNCLRRPYLFMERDEMSNLQRGPPIDASYKVSVHLAKRFQRRRFV